MKKILVLGSAGMAGHMVFTYLSEIKKYQVLGTTNSNDFGGTTLKMNIFDRENVENIIKKVNPDVIVNCIGMLIKSSKNNPDQAIYGNAYFPHYLKRIADDNSCKLIHISTDCVFSGKQGGYTEESFKDATDVYGISKSLGEIVDEKHLTIRTSIIGPEIKENGEGLFHWFMNQSAETNGYKSNIWSGVTTLELAKFIDWSLDTPLSGLVHLTNNTPISKFELLNIFNNVYERNLIINSDKDYVCDKSFLNTNKNIDYVVPSYFEMLEEQKKFMQEHHTFYNYW